MQSPDLPGRVRATVAALIDSRCTPSTIRSTQPADWAQTSRNCEGFHRDGAQEVSVAGMGITGLWSFLILVVGVSIALAATSIWLAKRSGIPARGSGYNSALSSFLTTVGLVYGALLGPVRFDPLLGM